MPKSRIFSFLRASYSENRVMIFPNSDVKHIAFVQNFPNFSKIVSISGSRCYKPPKIDFEVDHLHTWESSVDFSDFRCERHTVVFV